MIWSRCRGLSGTTESRIIPLSAHGHSRNSFVSGPGAVISPQTSLVKLILTQVILSLWALTSSFGYNYLPHSGIPSTFVIQTPALPDKINLSYFLCWIFFLLVTDPILTAHQCVAAQGLLLPAELKRTTHLRVYLCEWSLYLEIMLFRSGPSTPVQTWHQADRFSLAVLTLHHLNYEPFWAPLRESLPNEPSSSGGCD